MYYLREYTDKDIEQFREWLEKPHIKRWFSNQSAWLDEVVNRKTTFSFIKHFILQNDNNPIGFCQYYDYSKSGETWHGDSDVSNTYSIDYLIGEEKYLGKHISKELIKLLEEKIRQQTAAKRIIVQPEKDNLISRNLLRSTGYTYIKKFDYFEKILI